MNTECYRLIKEYYGEKITNRSKIPLINHINEGIKIIQYLSNDQVAIDGFCLHPLVQNDEDFKINALDVIKNDKIYPEAKLAVFEYRRVANNYLLHHISSRRPQLSVNESVNLMLIADKIQNRKDFELYHKDHPDALGLNCYFRDWLNLLKITEKDYRKIIKILK